VAKIQEANIAVIAEEAVIQEANIAVILYMLSNSLKVFCYFCDL